MSTSHDESHTDGDHGSNSSLRDGVIKVFLPIMAVAAVVYYLVSAPQLQPDYTPVVISPDAQAVALAQRVKPVGTVSMGDANKPLATGEEVYKAQCTACHASGAAGAPKSKDAAAWAPRIAQGLATLVNSAVKGKGAMGAQAGGTYNELEVTRAVVYMANASGAKFAEPAAPAEPAAAASGAAPAASAAK
jgi:cytochrome c5